MNVGMKITGAKEVEAMLRRMEKKEGVKAVKKGTRETQKSVVKPALERNAKELTTNAKNKVGSMAGEDMGVLISQNIAVRVATKLKKGSYGSDVVIKENPAFRHGASYIPAAIEYGHAAPGDAGGVKVAAPVPFMRKAFEESSQRAMYMAGLKIVEEIEKAAAKK